LVGEVVWRRAGLELPILVVHGKSHTGSDGWLVVSGVELHAGSRWEGLGPRITACLQLATEYSIPDDKIKFYLSNPS